MNLGLLGKAYKQVTISERKKKTKSEGGQRVIDYTGLDDGGIQWGMGKEDLELKVKTKKLYDCRRE